MGASVELLTRVGHPPRGREWDCVDRAGTVGPLDMHRAHDRDLDV